MIETSIQFHHGQPSAARAAAGCAPSACYALYDKRGIPILPGDTVKVFHFIAAVRREKRFMYKLVMGIETRGENKTPLMKLNHLDLIDALRSGKFTKTIGKLGALYKGGEERNCCLGVFCRIKGLERTVSSHVVLYDGCDDYAPPRLGLRDREGFLGRVGDKVFTLAELNDSGYTFEEIADILYWFVESNLIHTV